MTKRLQPSEPTVKRIPLTEPTARRLDPQVVAEALGGQTGDDRHGLTGKISAPGTIDRVYSPFEVACLDIQGKAVGRPVVDLLGGAVRDAVSSHRPVPSSRSVSR